MILSLQMWHSYSVLVSSLCGGVAGGLVAPWYPHHPLQHGSSSVKVDLDLLVPPTSKESEEPYLLLWSRAECELTLEVTATPFLLLDKLAIVYAPFLLPWLTAVCIMGVWHGLHWEVLVVFLYLAAR